MTNEQNAPRDECNECYCREAQHTGKTHKFTPIRFGEQSALDRAIQYLGAVEVTPGLYARKEAPSVPYEIIPKAILLEYKPEQIATFGHRDRQFCGIITMPTWWSPEQQFANRYPDGVVIAGITPAHSTTGASICITANLDTGEEVAL